MMDFSGNIKTAFCKFKLPLLVASMSYLGMIHPAVAQYPAPIRAAVTQTAATAQTGASQQPAQHRRHHNAAQVAQQQQNQTTDLTQPPEQQRIPGAPGAEVPPLYRPAVSMINGWLSGSVGGWHSNWLPNGYSLVASGGFTMPITYRFGIQMDGYDGVIAHDNLFMANGYLFWRNPCIAAVAFHYRYANIDHVYANLYGLHGEGYYWNFTGVLEGGSIHTNTRGGNGYAEAIVAWYADPNWRLDIGYLNIAGRQAGQVGTEYQFAFLPIPGISGYAAVGGGNHNLYYGYVGLKVYFGCNKSLLQRHREDTLDPSYDLLPGRQIQTLGFW